MKLVDKAGSNIIWKAIWRDRSQIAETLDDLHLKNWLLGRQMWQRRLSITGVFHPGHTSLDAPAPPQRRRRLAQAVKNVGGT